MTEYNVKITVVTKVEADSINEAADIAGEYGEKDVEELDEGEIQNVEVEESGGHVETLDD